VNVDIYIVFIISCSAVTVVWQNSVHCKNAPSILTTGTDANASWAVEERSRLSTEQSYRSGAGNGPSYHKDSGINQLLSQSAIRMNEGIYLHQST